MKKILTLIGFLALVHGQVVFANSGGVGESSTTPCTAINGSNTAAELPAPTVTPTSRPDNTGR